MSNPYSVFKTDPTLEAESGIILDYGDFRIRIGRAGGANKKYGKLLEARMAPYQRQMQAKTMDEDVATKLLVEVFAETIVFGCDVLDKEASTPENPVYKPGIIINEEGEIGADDKKNRVNLFISLPELFADVRKQANDFTLFQILKQEELVKN